MVKKREKTEVVIGAFYQRSTNPLDVVYTVGGGPGYIHGYNAKMKSFNTTPEEVLKWTQLAVNDFPHSPDPRLPYVYDLNWDIKYLSQLRRVEPSEKPAIEALLVRDFGVAKPFANLTKLEAVVRERNDIANDYIPNPLKAKVPKSLQNPSGPGR